MSSIYPVRSKRHGKAHCTLFNCIQPFITCTSDLKGICKISVLASLASKCLILTCNMLLLEQLSESAHNNTSPVEKQLRSTRTCLGGSSLAATLTVTSTTRGTVVVTRGARDIVIPPAGIGTAGGYASGCLGPPGDRKCSCTCQQMALLSAAAVMPQPFM